jgi:outer membrane protein assembly factor BamB
MFGRSVLVGRLARVLAPLAVACAAGCAQRDAPPTATSGADSSPEVRKDANAPAPAARAAEAPPPKPVDHAARAKEILDSSGVRGGLVVHVGCGKGGLTHLLRASESYLVHGLDADAGNVAAARERIRSQGLYGPVSVSRWRGAGLPYAENVVNLLVVESGVDVATAEAMRVLAPGGVACVERGGAWSKTVKPRPADIDEWTHYLHGPGNNVVASDTRVGPPRRLQWACGPLWTRSHEYTSSLVAMVSAGGRVFYVFDEGLTGVTPRSLPERWTLVARDAFNGVLLWKRSVPKWRPASWKSSALRSVPPSIPRLLVAEGDRVFIPLAGDAPVSILDAATGEELAICAGTEGAQELRCLDGVLLVRVAGALRAVSAETGENIWDAGAAALPQTMAASGGKVFYKSGKGGQAVECLDLRTGRELWKTEPAAPKAAAAPKKKKRRPPRAMLLAHGDLVLFTGAKGLEAVSADTGETRWTARAGLGGRGELFVAQGQAWHWNGHTVTGRDLATGEVKTEIRPDNVFTPGHHLRCYQSKATENYFITPHRGVEFISLTGGEHTQSDWIRGPCFYGIMPANGLLYAPPDPCFCYPGVKVTGFNALAPAGSGEPRALGGDRLEKGPAFGGTGAVADAGPDDPDDWPTYRHDARRAGATASAVPAEVSERWQVKLRAPLTPPVAAGARVYVAAKDEHTLYALSRDDGRELWRFTADGRIDSPPTVHGGRVLLGCTDGHVYCLRASDGELVWRFRAAPTDERIVAFGQLESPWRVHGSVLVTGGVAYCTAGRSTHLDGGIRVFGLDPATGKVLHETTLDTWARTREDAKGKPFVPAYHMEGANSDVLVSEGGFIYMGQYKFDPRLAEQDPPYVLADSGEKVTGMDLEGRPFVSADVAKTQGLEVHQRKWLENAARSLVAELRKKHGSFNIGHRRMGLRVFATGGFLDDSWYNRTYWMYSASWPGFYLAHRGAKTGQLLSVGPERTYGVQAYPNRNMQSPLFTPGGKGYLLFSDANDNEPVLSDETRETTKGWGFTRKAPPVWHAWVPIRMRAMVLAGETLFVAGPPDVVPEDDPYATFDGKTGAVLRAVAAADGKTLAEVKLDSSPVFDGLIAAGGRLYMSDRSGVVTCMAGQ